jgi:hypothetical protein
MMEDPAYENLLNWKNLYNYINKRFVFWEKTISLLMK